MTSRESEPDSLGALLEQLRAADRESIARLAVKEGLLTAERLEEAIRGADAGGASLLDWLVQREWLRPADVSRLRKTQRLAEGYPAMPQTVPMPPATNPRHLYVPVPREERYRLGAELGRGGLGCVYAAEDRDLRREVAVKLILGSTDTEFEERFVREARMTALLDHPNIVPVYDFGFLNHRDPTDGRVVRQLFICMKLVRGRTLHAVVQGLQTGDAESLREFSRTRLLGIFQSICLGVAYAHSRGVVHRDLKPANVMIGEFGETLVMDWGLAKAAGELNDSGGSGSPTPSDDGLSTQITLAGSVMGTPNYMSPEQATGKLEEVDHRSDIYALGGILYTLLTWQVPVPWKYGPDTQGKSASPPPSRGPGGDVLKSATIPPDLQAIWRRAMAASKQDRFQSALEMHREIQLFLEGAKAQERAEREAREHVGKGRALMSRFSDLKGEIVAQEKVVEEWSEKIKPHQRAEEKRPLWEAQARLKRLEDERIEAFAAASAEFGRALTVKADSTEALDATCEQYLDRFLEAEKRRDRKEMLLNRRTLERYDRDGRNGAKLDAPGGLSIRTFACGCACLAPIRHPGWRVEFGDDFTIPWRDGRARPELSLADTDRPVPAMKTFPEGVRWGHTARCARNEVQGTEVWIARYEERDLRLQPGERKLIGKTPLSGVELPQGSYRCALKADGFAETYLPVRIDRGGVWNQDVNLYRPEEIPKGFCYVPGGPFIFGGEHAGGGPEETKVSEDLFVARFPVIAREYLEFLNDLCASGRAEEARKRQPREGDVRFFREVGGHFEPIPESEKGVWLTSAELPVMGVSWFDAVALISWRSAREGLAYRLMHEEEWEKAARGVDARVFSWGDDYDPSFANNTLSHPGGPRICAPGSFPVDESPYGVVDLGGNMETWCTNAPEAPYPTWCCVRGGTWGDPAHRVRAAIRRGNERSFVFRNLGVRMAVSPIAMM
ncbi:MAG: hypothetical protein FD180_190 [Planctomycetota bacterium]|nr:MAG: hypothetical protein FD180_190 [Planctomycetota bacterium]